MQQGSNEWLAWRRKGIGASEIPVLMGESDFSTPYKLWLQKTGRAGEEEVSYAMQRGTGAEPKIRALYELHNDMDMPPELFEHAERRYLRASLDGYSSANGGLVAEFKYPSKEKHQLAIEGKIPPCYYGQVQAQMACSGAMATDYVSFDGKDIVVVQVLPDVEYIERMYAVAERFWWYVENDRPPPFVTRDFKLVRDKDSTALMKEYAAIVAKVEEAKARIAEKIAGDRVRCAGFRLIRTSGHLHIVPEPPAEAP